MSARYVTRPLSDRTWLRPPALREPTRFRATWPSTLVLLGREVDALDGRDLVIEVDVTEADLRIDGTLRARARADSPAVVVAFESRHGPLLYRCDRFTAQYYGQGEDWQQNVRAIALTLEALRAVDRYGASAHGEQYRGYRQIAAAAAGVPLTAERAWRELENLAGLGPLLDGHDVPRERVISVARRNAHPDSGGTREDWDRFTTAYDAVDQAAAP